MKKIGIAMAILLLAASSAMADDVFTGTLETWDTGIHIQNTDDVTSTVTLDFYKPNGTVVSSTQLYVPPGGVTVVQPGDYIGDGNYSAELFTDWGVFPTLISSGWNNNQGGFGAVNPLDDLAETLYLPLVQKNNNGMNSKIYIQNTCTVSHTVNVSYYNQNGIEPVDVVTGSIPAHGQWATPLPNMNSFVGSAIIQNLDQTDSLTAMVYNGGSSGARASAYNGFFEGLDGAYLPSVAAGGVEGWTSRVQIQNCVDVTATVGLTFIAEDGAVTGIQTLDIPPYGFVNPVLPATGFYSALVYSQNPHFAAVVNTVSDKGRANCYAAQNFSEVGHGLAFPAIPKNASGWDATMLVMNANDDSEEFDSSFFTVTGGLVATATFELDLFQAVAINLDTDQDILPYSFSGSAVLEGSSDLAGFVFLEAATGWGGVYEGWPIDLRRKEARKKNVTYYFPNITSGGIFEDILDQLPTDNDDLCFVESASKRSPLLPMAVAVVLGLTTVLAVRRRMNN